MVIITIIFVVYFYIQMSPDEPKLKVVRVSYPDIIEYDDKGNITGRNYYQGRMIIRHGADGKRYLYDIIDIKKET